MLLVRNSLGRGNPDVTAALKETKHDKEKTYDKIVAMMLDTCHNTIEERIIDKILKPDNFAIWDETYTKYLTFNKNVFQIIGPELKNTPSEKVVLDQIDSILKTPEVGLPADEETIDILTVTLGRYKYLAIGMFTGFSISFLFALFYYLVLKK